MYMIIPGYSESDIGPLGLNASFFLDGVHAYTLERAPRTGELSHEELTFNASNLDDGTHELLVIASPKLMGSDNTSFSTFTVFNKALYT